jgi:hypothetical protein
MKGLFQVAVVRLLVAAGVLFVGVASAAGGAACWQQVINDWADNSRVDGRYEIHCYQEALRRLPEDMRAYSSAPDDIARAMREEIRRREQESAPAPEPEEQEDTAVAPTSSGGSGTPAKPNAKKKEKKQEDAAMPDAGAVPESEGSRSDGAFGQALDEIGPSNASSFPLPLLVLGGITGLLLLAGGLGYLVKRGAPERSRPRSPSTR